MLNNRSVAKVIVFSIITCGIYALYWSYVTAKDLDEVGNLSVASPLIQFILIFCVSIVGYILFALSADKNLNEYREKMEYQVKIES